MDAALAGLASTQRVNFRDFMSIVEESNLDLAAQRDNVAIAQAQLTAARVYEDPSFQAGYGGDVSHNRQVTSYSGGISQTVLLGGKITARSFVANSGVNINVAQTTDFVRSLKRQAADAFVDAITAALLVERRQKGLLRAQQLVVFNAARVMSDDIRQGELLRSRVAALQARDEIIKAQSLFQQSLVQMAVLVGDRWHGDLFYPVGNLDIATREFNIEDLVKHALSSRADINAAFYSLEQARAQYNLVEANRVPDVSVGIAYNHFTRVTNPIDPSPAWDWLGVTLSIPIPLSNLNRGELAGARYTELQAQKALKSIRLKAELEVRSSYERYVLAVDSVEQYAKELVRDSDSLYKAKLYTLQQGKTSLLDVLDAYNTINDVYLGYYAALNEQAKALVALETAAGIWDLNF
ncbi:MAG TPA: TolC family protein [Candidatus Binataceae bacterium]|nr:TolC family protein [Candidatus Binataceae bacterium]